MKEFAGKTVFGVKHSNSLDKGLTITFTDGTILEIEATKSAELLVTVDDKKVGENWLMEAA